MFPGFILYPFAVVIKLRTFYDVESFSMDKKTRRHIGLILSNSFGLVFIKYNLLY